MKLLFQLVYVYKCVDAIWPRHTIYRCGIKSHLFKLNVAYQYIFKIFYFILFSTVLLVCILCVLWHMDPCGLNQINKIKK